MFCKAMRHYLIKRPFAAAAKNNHRERLQNHMASADYFCQVRFL
jgi:hypothetical protein